MSHAARQWRGGSRSAALEVAEEREAGEHSEAMEVVLWGVGVSYEMEDGIYLGH